MLPNATATTERAPRRTTTNRRRGLGRVDPAERKLATRGVDVGAA